VLLMSYNSPGSVFGPPHGPSPEASAPLVLIFERNDAVAVPLLSQLRVAGYDVRSARTPVELFDTAQKHAVALVLVDLGSAAAGRREFWVALDAQRRGRAIQVLTFRLVSDASAMEADFDLSARALADVEIRGPHELQVLVDAVRQRVPLNGSMPSAAVTMPPLGMGSILSANPFDSTAPAPNGLNGHGFIGGQGMSNGNALGNGAGYANGKANDYGAPGMGFNPFAVPAADGFGGFGQPGGMPESRPLADPGAPYAPPPPAPTFSPFAPPAPGQEPQSPFAQPSTVNPFTPAARDASPFDQPYSQNPFAASAATAATADPLARDPFAGSRLPWPGSGNGNGSFPGPAGASVPSAPGGGYGVTNRNERDGSTPHGVLADAWVPPGGDEPLQHVTLRPEALPPASDRAHVREPDWARPTQGPELDQTDAAFPAYDTALPRQKRRGDDDPQLHDATAPVSAQLPALTGGPNGRAERALGTVLVEGALLSPQKLEVLKGIQHMLSTVDMDFRLGELALLFKFLSPDQLLAALLVSRGLVSPQQIAALGRIKQELGGSGMGYDLETLLLMFHILPAEELRALRSELS
jgi:CheY-like chemotaxis protein